MNSKKDNEYAFEKIGLVGRVDSSQAVSTLEFLCDFLLAKKKQVVLEEVTGVALGNFNGAARVCDLSALCQEVDLVIAVGGDGTLLSAGRSAASHSTPLLGVNRGKLGFLTDINPASLEESLRQIFKGKFVFDERFLLEAQIAGKSSGQALNDIVLTAGSAVSMVEYELYVDDKFVYSQSADGLIISTPTGSTAYALSGGGPIMHPSLDAIVLVPICPHMLSVRPMVIDGNSKISIVPNYDLRALPQISCDGHDVITLQKGLSLTIEKSHNHLRLLHPNNHEFYEACRSKLGWGKKFT